MKRFITPSYTFTPGASGAGTVDLSSISSFDVKRLLAIINLTRGKTIFATGSETLKMVSEAAGVVTLFADTTGHDAADKLQIVYEEIDSPLPTGASTAAKQDEIKTSIDDVTATLLTIAGYEDGIEGLLTDVKTKLLDSIAVTGTFWQATQPVSQIALTPSYQEITNLTTTPQTFTAPANAKCCKVYADGVNSENIRVKIGGTATTSSGVRVEPGRDVDFDFAADISVIAEAGSGLKVNVHFGV